MSEKRALLDQAADLVRRAAAETNNGERWLLLEKAVELHRMAATHPDDEPADQNGG